MNRLGWVDAPRVSLTQWEELTRFAAAARRDGLTRVVVCGMGGSSLAPQVLAASFGASSLTALDSTDPGAVLAVERSGRRDTRFGGLLERGRTVGPVLLVHTVPPR